MKKLLRCGALIFSLVISLLITVAARPLSSGPERPPGSDKTLSPYFLVKTDDPEKDLLPLKATRADVKIAGVVAAVKITQVYQNQGKKPLEALYVFPASTRAARSTPCA